MLINFNRAEKTSECVHLRTVIHAQKERHKREVVEHERQKRELERAELDLRADMKALQETVSRQCGELEECRQVTDRQAQQILTLDQKREAYEVSYFPLVFQKSKIAEKYFT